MLNKVSPVRRDRFRVQHQEDSRVLPYRISLLCFCLPLVTVHLTWLVASASGNLDFCVPYWAHCHSISATGRHYPEALIFKALFIPIAVLMALYWLHLHRWVTLISAGLRNSGLIRAQGITACVALLVYTLTLGVEESFFPVARRIGVVVYFSFTSFAHLLLLNTLRDVDVARCDLAPEKQYLTVTCALLVIAAITSAPLGFWWQGWHAWENAFEWCFSLVMISLFFWVGKMWKKTAHLTRVSHLTRVGEPD